MTDNYLRERGETMKKITARRISLVALILILTVMFTACGNKSKDEENIAHPVSITISITYPEGSGVESVKDVPFKVEEGTSALDALQLYCNSNSLALNIDTTNSKVYGIGGINNGDSVESTAADEGKKVAGEWKLKINNKSPKGGEGKAILKEGDKMSWTYEKTE